MDIQRTRKTCLDNCTKTIKEKGEELDGTTRDRTMPFRPWKELMDTTGERGFAVEAILVATVIHLPRTWIAIQYLNAVKDNAPIDE